MRTRRQRGSAWLAALACSQLLAACFVDDGECTSEGVVVEPCTVSMKTGGSVELQASVPGEPAATVVWEVDPNVPNSFVPDEDGNRLQLISSTGLGGTYSLRAVHPDDPTRFAGVSLSVVVPSYGYPPPPVQISGNNAQNKGTAVASGGSYYYVAYADPDRDPVPLGGAATNHFVKQFRRSDNSFVGEISGQFLGFQSGGVAPNVAADCQGNGYWIDLPVGQQQLVLNRLTPGGAHETFTLIAPSTVRAFAVGCDGSMYLVGVTGQNTELFRIPAFGQPAQVLDISSSYGLLFAVSALAVDPEGRLMIAAFGSFQGLVGSLDPSLVRITPEGELDLEFDASKSIPLFTDVTAVAVDDEGVVYAAFSSLVGSLQATRAVGEGAFRIKALNALGVQVNAIRDYQYTCVPPCETPDCGTKIPFENIVGLAAFSGGTLLVADDVSLFEVPAECQVAIRFILLTL